MLNKFVLPLLFLVTLFLITSIDVVAAEENQRKTLVYGEHYTTTCRASNEIDIVTLSYTKPKRCSVTFIKPVAVDWISISHQPTIKRDSYRIDLTTFNTEGREITLGILKHSWPSSYSQKPSPKGEIVPVEGEYAYMKEFFLTPISPYNSGYINLKSTRIVGHDVEPFLNVKSDVTYDSAKIIVDAPFSDKIRVDGEELTTNVYNMSGLKPETEYTINVEADFANSDTLKKTYKFKTAAKTYAGLSNYQASDITDTSAKISWNLPKEPYFSHVEINGQDVGKSVNYLLKKLKPSTDYTYKVYAVYDDKKVESIIKFTTAKEVDRTPPKDVGNLRAIPDVDFVLLHWQKPVDLDYAKTYIYRNNTLIATLTDEQTYKDIKLSPDTNYTYRFVTEDKNGNKSDGVKVLTKTKEDLSDDIPDAPIISVKPLSKGGRVTFDNKKPNRIAGYNVYLVNNDTKKVTLLDYLSPLTAYAADNRVNTSLVSSVSYQISNLVNDKQYAVYAIAVGSNGVESERSNTVSFTPSASSVPAVDVDDGYNLSDVATGVGSWFSSFWLILAFAIGIMVSFIVANRIKNLFLS